MFYPNLASVFEQHKLNRLAEFISSTLDDKFSAKSHGDFAQWQTAIKNLPAVTPNNITLTNDTVSVGAENELNPGQHEQLLASLQTLMPWRKGPFSLFGHFIDTEWRSDWKWQRIAPHLHSLKNKKILDVGCGSGYHCWRMLGEEAALVVGIEPYILYCLQFVLFNHYIKTDNAFVLPYALEELPDNLQKFDTVFSMGVLYHRKSPLEHLLQLRNTLKPGGQLVLETLVIEGGPLEALVPEDRYAQMGNVWFIPSVEALLHWIRKCGFVDARLVDKTRTTTEEQRSTAWMTKHSLADFLDPQDPNKTIEGYPGPVRATIIANKK
jgi:tRNA (mo5U34)-methyltransferase